MNGTPLRVTPEALAPPADRCDRAGEQLSAVARALAGMTAPTGHCDSEAAVEAAAGQLSAVVAELAAVAHAKGTGLRAAAEAYAAAERRASGY